MFLPDQGLPRFYWMLAVEAFAIFYTGGEAECSGVRPVAPAASPEH
jgi:hypothetical protein